MTPLDVCSRSLPSPAMTAAAAAGFFSVTPCSMDRAASASWRLLLGDRTTFPPVPEGFSENRGFHRKKMLIVQLRFGMVLTNVFD